MIPTADDAIRAGPPPAAIPDIPYQALPPAPADALQTTPRPSLPSPTPVVPTELPEVPFLAKSAIPCLPLPAAEIERARALLRMGLTVPDIEQRLAARGLSANAARAVVDHVLEERTRQGLEPLERAERSRRRHRVVSGVVLLADLCQAYWFFGPRSACWAGLRLMLPLACIWFGGAMGSYTGLFSFITRRSSGIVVRWLGWLVLMLMSIRMLWLGLILRRP
jgi:hypothetical protein